MTFNECQISTQSPVKYLAKSKESHKRLHDERVAWNLCIRCGRPLNGVKTLHCSACLEKYAEIREKNREKLRETQRQRVADHRARGLCINCNAPAVAAGRCAYHRQYNNLLNRERRKFKNDGSDNREVR